MELTKIDATHLLISYSNSELPCAPAQMTAKDALNLCRHALRLRGLMPHGRLRVQAYIRSEGLLLFAECAVTECRLYRFSSLENTIGAAHTLYRVCAPPSTLFYLNRSYTLALFAGDEQTDRILRQFGNAQADTQTQLTKLCRAAIVLFPGCAVSSLAKWFHV